MTAIVSIMQGEAFCSIQHRREESKERGKTMFQYILVTGRVLHESRLPVLMMHATPVEPDLVENQHTPAVAQKLPG